MTNDEILNLYKFAKDPAAQITILAELTLKPVKEIISIIRAGGYEVDETQIAIPTGRAEWRSWTLEDDKRLIELYSKNLSFKQIGICLSRTKDSVRHRYAKLLKKGVVNAQTFS